MKHNPKVVEAFWKAHGIPQPITEHKFAEHIKYVDKAGRNRTRGWAFDYAWTFDEIRSSRYCNLALEVEGGVWTGGRHTSGAGFVKDMEKYNEAAALEWRIIRVQPCDLLKTQTANLIKRCLGLE